MRATRVLHASAVDFTAAKLLKPQLVFLQERGYDVRVACGRTDEQHWQSLRAFDCLDISFPRSLEPLEMARSAMRLRNAAKAWDADILHLHTPAASFPVRAMPRLLLGSNTRIVYTVHGYLHAWPALGRRERLIQQIEKWESRRTDLTFFQSMEDLEQARARGYAGDPTYLGNGVEDSWFDIPAPARDAGSPLQLLFVGRLVREKGIIDLLHAVQRVPNVALHVAGAALASDRDPVTEEVQRLAQGALEGRVFLHGMLDRPELQRLYETMDAVCLPSYREGVPRSVIEGLAAARPVVGSEIRGNRELIQHGHNGLLFRAGDVTALSEALSSLAEAGVDEFGRMSRAAREGSDAQSREDRVFERLERGYHRVLSDASGHEVRGEASQWKSW